MTVSPQNHPVLTLHPALGNNASAVRIHKVWGPYSSDLLTYPESSPNDPIPFLFVEVPSWALRTKHTFLNMALGTGLFSLHCQLSSACWLHSRTSDKPWALLPSGPHVGYCPFLDWPFLIPSSTSSEFILEINIYIYVCVLQTFPDF